jgi:hypothetical protein
MRRYHMQSTLTRTQVVQGIYIDFEPKNTAPATFGWLWVTLDGKEHFEQAVFDPGLRPQPPDNVLEAWKYPSVRVCSIEDAFVRVVELSEQLGVPIIVWSKREEDILKSCDISEALRQKIEARIVNALPIARRWVRKTHGREALVRDDHGNRYTLLNIAKLTGYSVAELWGSEERARELHEALHQIEIHGDYVSSPSSARQFWRIFLEYRDIVLRVTRDVMNHIIPEPPVAAISVPGRKVRGPQYATRPFPEGSCPDCGGVLSRYVYGMTQGLPPGQISGGCQVWPGMPSYRCDYCWEDFVAVRGKRPRRVTRRDRCIMMVKDWGWAPKSVATNQGIPIKVFERWLSESEIR